MQDDLISIVMPAYNSELYIDNAIESVLHQTYPFWELIIVDDCSTDRTQEIITKYAESDKRVRFYVNPKNSGAAVSRNKALREAKGNYVAFLDSDDVWEKEKLSKQLAFMKQNDYAFTYTDYRICLNGRWLPYINTAPNHIKKWKMYCYCYFSTITVMYDRRKIGLLQIPDLKKNNDYALWLKAVHQSDFHRLPECLSYYIKHDGSISSGNKWKLIKYHYIMFKSLDYSYFLSLLYTGLNMVCGIHKKFFYKRKVSEI